MSMASIIFAFKFQNTNPERGRKPKEIRAIICTLTFQNTNPERGRKRTVGQSDSVVSVEFQNTNPERGRKLHHLPHKSYRKAMYFRTRTPKGDGN